MWKIGWLIVALCWMSVSAAAGERETRNHMKRIAAHMEDILPLWADSRQRDQLGFYEKLRHSLEALVRESDALARHGEEKGKSFELAAHALTADAAQMRTFLREKNDDGALFMVGPLLDSCVSCHSRLPAGGSSSIGNQLVSKVDMDALSRSDRLRVRLASRQFDDAARDLEFALAENVDAESPGVSLHGLLVDYLVLNIRVRGDLNRPRLFLETLIDREDVGKYLSSEVEYWIRTLKQVPLVATEAAPLDRARAYLERGDQLRLFPADGVSLVYDIAGSGVLYRLLENPDGLSEREVALAYYLLGAAESRIRRPLWNERWDDYLEIAIQRAPGTEIAREALRVLEIELVAYWAPADRESLPDSVRERIETLRRVAEGTKVDG